MFAHIPERQWNHFANTFYGICQLYEKFTKEMQQLLNSFPGYLKKDVQEVIKILPLNNSAKSYNGQEYSISVLVNDQDLSVCFKGESLRIPTRVYFNEPDFPLESNLTSLQSAILNCVYLRHHNGFVRQRRLEKLVNRSEDFIVPFALQLLGEYV